MELKIFNSEKCRNSEKQRRKKMKKTKCWFFQNVNKISKTNQSKKKRERTQITKIRNEREDLIIDPMGIKGSQIS